MPRTRLLVPAVSVVVLFLATGLAVYLTAALGSVSPVADLPDPPALQPVSPPGVARQPGGLVSNPGPARLDTTTPPPELPPVKPLVTLPPEEQARVDQAIERGRDYLCKQQQSDGTWGSSGYPVGYAALPGLALLECGVAGTDPPVQKAAEFIRGAVRGLKATYEISLALLFLDRLADPKDEAVVRTLALRLIAGQTAAGGWSYQCPVLSGEDESRLLTLLRESRPRTAEELLIPGPDNKKPDWLAPRMEGRPLPSLVRGRPEAEESGRVGRASARPTTPPQALPPHLQKVPALQTPKKEAPFPSSDASDNSNTQFAVLGLWAAARHDVPTERALALVVTRFRSSQGSAGGWGYNYKAGGSPSTPAMTCAGLLGLAVGHGLTTSPGREAADQPKVEDLAIQKGLQALAENIDRPSESRPEGGRGQAGINLYFLWSLERVAVVYHLPTIAGKEWYGWGTELLLDAQQPQGNWACGTYHGSTSILDTSLALLFLKRANLAQDLTSKLQVLTRIR